MSAVATPSGKVGRTSSTYTFPVGLTPKQEHDYMDREMDHHFNRDIPDTITPTRSSLARVLRYENDAVVAKMMKEYKLSLEDATVLFKDTLRFLWLCGTFKGDITPPKKIDKGWHTFILFTMDYQKFCHKYFGRFIHHRPHRPTDAPDDGSGIRRVLSLVSEHLGSKLSNNWRFGKAAGCGRSEGWCSKCGGSSCGTGG